MSLSCLPFNHPSFYDIGLKDGNGLMTFLTEAELKQGAVQHKREWGADKCEQCGQYVALWAWGEYDIFFDSVSRAYTVCKACFVYDWRNFGCGSNDPPPCSCPPGAISGEKVDSGCALHVVRPMQRLPPGFPRKLVPHNYAITVPGRGFNKLDAAVAAWRKCFCARECAVEAWRAPKKFVARQPAVVAQPYPTTAESRVQLREGKKVKDKKQKESQAKESLLAEEIFRNYA
ncbi:hypothetical protein B0H19DRAFT_1253924 [Mycena capillaripes]|nr:hypothetical protein B0H19DRAFT_1253924 [Mycena capillaripes]